LLQSVDVAVGALVKVVILLMSHVRFGRELLLVVMIPVCDLLVIYLPISDLLAS